MLKEYLTSIANAIRSKLGSTAKINAQDFVSKIGEVYDEGYLRGIPYGYGQGKQEGIEQGKLELLTDSKYMNANVSGTAIAVNDVNAIEHNVGIKLTSETITNFSNVEVSRYGKNLCGDNFADYKHDMTYGYKYIGKNTLRVSLIDKDTSVDVSGCYIGFAREPKNGSEIRWFIQNGVINTNVKTNIIANNEIIPYLIFYPNKEEAFNRMMQRWDIQVELGNTATAYEPYIEPTTYTAKANGTVEGVTSISPNMTLLTNNNNVVINANYLRDIDTYIDNLKTNVALTGGE